MKEAVRKNFSTGIGKSIALLAFASVAARAFVGFASGERTPEYVGGTGRLIGQVIGGGVMVFAVALLAFFAVRVMRGKGAESTSGLFAGLIAAALMAAIMFIGSQPTSGT